MKYVGFILLISISILVVIIIFKNIFSKDCKTRYKYKKINSLMTNTELKYFNALKSILFRTPYVLLPQIPLSSIVTRVNKHKFQSELNRVVDFCIFSPEFSPLICIEINDSSHLLKQRIERDKKVKNILKLAKIPLVTIWTNEKFDYKQIAQKLKNCGLKLNLRNIYNEIQ
ncbi:MAG: DUF2726 domain-containing protein [Clostridia bacterium]|nr:DUF2726 domain-containing protein [Clostridia bacterium]